MKATLLLRERVLFGERAFAEMVLWQLPKSVPGSKHSFKYRLAFVLHDKCVLRYDNEAGKGDHRHISSQESDYLFESPEKLIQDFLNDAKGIYHENSNP